MKPRLFQWQQEHGEAFIFGRSDWQYVLNTFCFGYNIGYKFVQTTGRPLQRQLPGHRRG